MTGKEVPSFNSLPLIVKQLSIYKKILTYKKTHVKVVRKVMPLKRNFDWNLSKMNLSLNLFTCRGFNSSRQKPSKVILSTRHLERSQSSPNLDYLFVKRIN